MPVAPQGGPRYRLVKYFVFALSVCDVRKQPLIRSFFRLLSLLALVAAILTGTLDSIQSVASSSVVVTSLGNHWQNLDVVSLAMAEAAVAHYIHADAWRWAIAPVLSQPAFAVFLMLALLFWMIGYRRPRFAGRFSA